MEQSPFQKLIVTQLLIALMIEAASAPETSVNFYQTTRRNIPQESHLHTFRRENLKSHTVITSLNIINKLILVMEKFVFLAVRTSSSPVLDLGLLLFFGSLIYFDIW
jgi:hypothetical protein